MTANVADNARLLEVIAGPDGLDSRQGEVRVERYGEALGAGIDGLRIGVLREGFARPESQPEVDAALRGTARRFEKLGARVSEVSVPAHRSAGLAGFGAVQSFVHTLLWTDGCPSGREDLFPTSYLEYHRRWRERASELSAPMKTILLLSDYLREQSGWRLPARSMNAMRGLRAAYDAALERCDALLMPTTPMVATPLPEPDAPPEVLVARAFAPVGNTLPFDHTHHPALSFPCASHDGLPVGAMLVGRRFEEGVLYRLAHAFERHAEWRTLGP
jgi:amidase